MNEQQWIEYGLTAGNAYHEGERTEVRKAALKPGDAMAAEEPSSGGHTCHTLAGPVDKKHTSCDSNGTELGCRPDTT